MTYRKLTLAAGLSALIVFAPSAAAQAASGNPAHLNHGSVVPHALYKEFTGYTYPETSAGLAACNQEGIIQSDKYASNGWVCVPNQPDAGLYGLYVTFLICHPACVVTQPTGRVI